MWTNDNYGWRKGTSSMSNQENLHFQYCQKLVILSEGLKAVLLARRAGEADYDGVYSFIGGKMETTDNGLVDGMTREKNEEIGSMARVRILAGESHNVFFRKQDGNAMILPHIAAVYDGGPIELNEEYSDYKWVKIEELPAFEPKIDTVMTAVHWAIGRLSTASEADFTTI